MLHKMKINDNAFDRMKKGSKKREYRVNDEKRQFIRCVDLLELAKITNPEETIVMDVKNIENYITLEEAVSSHFDEDFSDRHNDIKSTVASFYEKGYYTEEEVQKDGIVVFELKNIE